jgi:hypothetical protein
MEVEQSRERCQRIAVSLNVTGRQLKLPPKWVNFLSEMCYRRRIFHGGSMAGNRRY